MDRIYIFLLDNLNNTKEEVKMTKPKTYQELLSKLSKNKNLPKYYEIYTIGKNNKEIKLNNEEKYSKIEDILFIREIKMLDDSLYSLNYKRLSESQQEKLDEKYNCILCSMIIKKENPYLCYQCQKIFHIKCLDDWDKKCKEENKAFSCPNCRNELPKEKWNKKIDHEGNRNDNANLMNKMNEIKLNNNMRNNINIIKDKKTQELKRKEVEHNELIKVYEKYIKKTIEIFKNILNQINQIHHLLNMPKNNDLNNLISFYPLNIDNLYVEDISNIIYYELDLFKNNLKNIDRKEKEQVNDDINKNFIKKTEIILGDNIFKTFNEEQITILKMAVNFYNENNCPKMNFNNQIQINSLINTLFNQNIKFEDKTYMFNYITHDKRRKRIKFICNNKLGSSLFDIPCFFTKKELYTIAERYKKFHSTIIVLIHKNKFFKNDESSIDEISSGDIIWIIENKLYPETLIILVYKINTMIL